MKERKSAKIFYGKSKIGIFSIVFYNFYSSSLFLAFQLSPAPLSFIPLQQLAVFSIIGGRRSRSRRKEEGRGGGRMLIRWIHT
jgi:hypothetical protein